MVREGLGSALAHVAPEGGASPSSGSSSAARSYSGTPSSAATTTAQDRMLIVVAEQFRPTCIPPVEEETPRCTEIRHT